MQFNTFILTYGLTILSIAATGISLLIAIIKAKKNGNTKGIIDLLNKIPSLVITAENLFGNGKGTAKLDYVMTQLRLSALQCNIKIPDEELIAQINNIVTATKQVNTTPTQCNTATNNTPETKAVEQQCVNAISIN